MLQKDMTFKPLINKAIGINHTSQYQQITPIGFHSHSRFRFLRRRSSFVSSNFDIGVVSFIESLVDGSDGVEQFQNSISIINSLIIQQLNINMSIQPFNTMVIQPLIADTGLQTSFSKPSYYVSLGLFLITLPGY